MDLREKTSFVQKVSEFSIRFRLIEVLVAMVLCLTALFNINGVLDSLILLSVQMENFLIDVMFSGHSAITSSYIIIIAVFILFIFRWFFFGFTCGLLWFFFLIFNCLFLLTVGEFKDIMQILLAVIFTIAITGFFFIRSLLVKTILPLILLVYSLCAWLIFLGISNLALFGIVSIFLADVFHLIFVISHLISKDKTKKKTLSGAIASGVRKTIPVSLLTVILLIILDSAFYFIKMPLIASENIALSIIIYLCYVIWMPFFSAALLSFCPLENTCKKIMGKSK